MVLYKKSDVAPEEVKRAEMAVRCLSELVVTHSEFNYRKNVIATLIHITTCRFSAPVEKAVEAVRRVVKQDNQGDVTVDVLASISKVAKTKVSYTRNDQTYHDTIIREVYFIFSLRSVL